MGLLDELRRLTRPYQEEEDELEDFIPQREAAPPVHNEERHDKVVNIHTTTQLQVVLVKPERFDAAPEIADHLRDKRTVVLNLESANKEIARRLVDFLSGVAYAQDGKIKRVANSTYIITPYNVDIMGDLIDELENNGLYF
ncbi:MAG: cell division protein SepF [Oscillospiraceae bacterium]|nr:cell division protein SepF [Oscillospiraceae bacterium]